MNIQLLKEMGQEAAYSAARLGATLKRLEGLLEDSDNEFPGECLVLLSDLAGELKRLDERVQAFDTQIKAIGRMMPACQRLQKILDIGPLTSIALAAAVADASHFRNGRELSAFLDLVPHQRSTGGRTVLLSISKRGDKYLK